MSDNKDSVSAGIVATGVPEPEQYKLHEAIAEINEKMPNLFGDKDPTAEIIAERNSPVIPEGSEKPDYQFPPRGSQDWLDVVTAFIMRIGNYMLKNKQSEHYPLWGEQMKQHVEEIRAWYKEINPEKHDVTIRLMDESWGQRSTRERPDKQAIDDTLKAENQEDIWNEVFFRGEDIAVLVSKFTITRKP